MAFGAPFPGGGIVTGQFLGQAPGFSGTFNLGKAAPNRSIVVFGGCVTGGVYTGCSVAGITATQIESVNIADGVIGMYVAEVPNGTSGLISLSASGAIGVGLITTYAVYGARNPLSPVAAANAGFSTSFNAPAGSFVCGGTYGFQATNGAWSGLNTDGVIAESEQPTINVVYCMVAGSRQLLAPTSFSVSCSPGTPIGAAAMWSP
jgi:hypothetical protein